MKEENQQRQSSPAEEEIQQKPSAWKRLIKKKWFFPAIYLAAAALILAFITWYQNTNDFAIDPDEIGYEGVEEETPADQQSMGEDAYGYADNDEATPVTAQNETMDWPVADGEANVVVGFFEDEASAEEQQEAMVEYDNQYHPSHGMDFAREDGEAFDVLAALSGTVITSGKDPLLGNYVEVEHDDGLVTVYQSLEGVQVSEGDMVEKGDIIGQAGRSVFRKDLGVHFHFEVREDGAPVNPMAYLDKDNAQEDTESKTNDEAETHADGESEADVQEDAGSDTEADNGSDNQTERESDANQTEEESDAQQNE